MTPDSPRRAVEPTPPAGGGHTWPAASGSRLPVFRSIFADIGDEQSIEASLSTFSAHLKNLAEILDEATASSLVLIDELGSGTDPLEGASLGWSILEELTARGATTLSTSHLGALKELATQVSGVVNGSLQFDAEHLAPGDLLLEEREESATAKTEHPVRMTQGGLDRETSKRLVYPYRRPRGAVFPDVPTLAAGYSMRARAGGSPGRRSRPPRRTPPA